MADGPSLAKDAPSEPCQVVPQEDVCWGHHQRAEAGLGCRSTSGIRWRGLQLLHRHIWPTLPERLCALLQRSTLPATVGLLVWK